MIVTDEPTYREPNYSDGDTPYDEGRKAHADGLDVSENPYHRDHQEPPFLDWYRGWMDANDDATT
jgi:hypothetical protein